MNIDEITAKLNQMMSAEYCCEELKQAGKQWIHACHTNELPQVTERLIQELQESILPIDDLIRYCKAQREDWFSSAAEASELLAHAEELRARGEQYCDCEACKTAQELLTFLSIPFSSPQDVKSDNSQNEPKT